jgi:hypothetical protein
LNQRISHCLTHILSHFIKHLRPKNHHKSIINTRKNKSFDPATREQYWIPTVRIHSQKTKNQTGKGGTSNKLLPEYLERSHTRCCSRTRSQDKRRAVPLLWFSRKQIIETAHQEKVRAARDRSNETADPRRWCFSAGGIVSCLGREPKSIHSMAQDTVGKSTQQACSRTENRCKSRQQNRDLDAKKNRTGKLAGA